MQALARAMVNATVSSMLPLLEAVAGMPETCVWVGETFGIAPIPSGRCVFLSQGIPHCASIAVGLRAALHVPDSVTIIESTMVYDESKVLTFRLPDMAKNPLPSNSTEQAQWLADGVQALLPLAAATLHHPCALTCPFGGVLDIERKAHVFVRGTVPHAALILQQVKVLLHWDATSFPLGCTEAVLTDDPTASIVHPCFQVLP
jgi:hypothetical protein